MALQRTGGKYGHGDHVHGTGMGALLGIIERI